MKQTEIVQKFYLREQTVNKDGSRSDKKGAPPIACVFLHQDAEGIVSRGISICSELDNWNRKAGTVKAMRRCYEARKHKGSKYPIGYPVQVRDKVTGEKSEDTRNAGLLFMATWRDRFGSDNIPGFKSSYNPVISDYERGLLDRKRNELIVLPGDSIRLLSTVYKAVDT
jgi:hypothetical protein